MHSDRLAEELTSVNKDCLLLQAGQKSQEISGTMSRFNTCLWTVRIQKIKSCCRTTYRSPGSLKQTPPQSSSYTHTWGTSMRRTLVCLQDTLREFRFSISSVTQCDTWKIPGMKEATPTALSKSRLHMYVHRAWWMEAGRAGTGHTWRGVTSISCPYKFPLFTGTWKHSAAITLHTDAVLR